MVNLARLTGQEQVEAEVSRLFESGQRAVAIVGPPGSGKTWTAHAIGRRFGSEAVQPLFAQVTRPESTTSAYRPFEQLRPAGIDTTEAALGAARTAIGAGVQLVGGGGLGWSLFDWVHSTLKPVASPARFSLTEAERGHIASLRRLARNRDFLLIADNVQWWDPPSQELLNKLLEEEFWSPESFIAKSNVLLTLTSSVETPDRPIGDIGNLQFYGLAKVVLPRCDLVAFRAALRTFGLRAQLPDEIVSNLFRLAGGNLKIARILAASIDNATSAVDLLGMDSASALLVRALELRLGDPSFDRSRFLPVLKSLSLIPDDFTENHVLCLHKDQLSREEVFALLGEAVQNELLDYYDCTYTFSHPTVRQYLNQALPDTEAARVSLRLGNCLRLLRPADYRLQGIAFAQGGDQGEAEICFALAKLGAKRMRQPIELSLSAEHAAELQASRHGLFVEKLCCAYDAAASGNFHEASDNLARSGEPHAFPLYLEKVYLESLCRMELRRIDLARETASTLATCLSELKARQLAQDATQSTFPEIELRLQLLQIQAHVLAADVPQARKATETAKIELHKRAAFDPDARVKLHQILRKANAIHLCSVAEPQVRQAVNFFAPSSEGELPQYPLEYYRSLTNLSGVLIQMGKWKEAIDYSRLAINVTERMPEQDFPRRDVPANNLVVAAFRDERLSADEAAELQKKISPPVGGLVDNFQHRSNLATYLALAGKQEEAKLVIRDLEQELEFFEISEPYMYFHLRTKLGSIQMLEGQFMLAKVLLDETDAFIDSWNWPARAALKRRNQLLRHLVGSRQSFEASRLDSYCIDTDPVGSGDGWSHFGRVFLLSELQFWSDQ